MAASGGWQGHVRAISKSIRDFALTVLIVGGIQILVSLLAWPILFRSHPLGFCMALSLVGFASWFLAFILSFGSRRRMMGIRSLGRNAGPPPPPRPPERSLRTQLERSGCGFVLIVSSALPLGLAFILRLQADLRTGKTLSDIFPPMPVP